MEEAWANGDVAGRGPAPAPRLKRGVRLRYGYRERIHSGCGPVSPGRGRGALRILVHIAALAVFYLAFSGALFLGLQVSPLYGEPRPGGRLRAHRALRLARLRPALARQSPGRLRSRAASNPPPVGPPRRRADGCTCRRAHHGAAVSVAIGDWSVITSTSSRDSLSKARHIATSSHESQGPCSSPVASSTTV